MPARRAAGKRSRSPSPSFDNPLRWGGGNSRPRRTLYLGSVIVKQFKGPAKNQKAILDTFQEEGWPTRIDDPLPHIPDQDPKERLHDTIKSLNRHQVHRLLVFEGDGTGEGVQWRQVDQTFTRASPELLLICQSTVRIIGSSMAQKCCY